jgi:hypothetical protein
MSLDSFVESYSGSMRRRYEKALTDYMQRGVSKADAKVKSFIKSERVLDPEYYLGKVVDPRMIHPRSPVYNLLLGSYLKPVAAENLKHCGLRVMLRGLDLKERARRVLQHLDMVGDCDVYELDAHRWDGHVNGYTLSQEHRIYNGIYGDPELRELLSWQKNSKCVTQTGMRYKLNSRCSGDYNTSLGNHLLMYCLLYSYMRDRFGINKKWSVVIDGDNVIVIVRKGHDLGIRHLKKHFACMGQDVDLEKFEDKEVLQFCRSKIYHSPQGPTFCRDPRRVLGGLLTIYRNLECFEDYMRQILIGESYVSCGVPIVSEYVHHMLRVLDKRKFKRGLKLPESHFDYMARFYSKSIACEQVQYTQDQLLAYLRLWGISLSEYRHVIDMIPTMEIEHRDFIWLPAVPVVDN